MNRAQLIALFAAVAVAVALSVVGIWANDRAACGETRLTVTPSGNLGGGGLLGQECVDERSYLTYEAGAHWWWVAAVAVVALTLAVLPLLRARN